MFSYYFCLLCALVGLAQGTIFERPCRTVEVVQDFQVDKYLGLWYDLEHYEASFEQNTDCVTAEYSRYEDGSIRVFNSAVRLTDGLLYAVDGRAVLSYPEVEVLEAKLNVSFYGAPNDESNYWVLDTDYENYAIVWSCEPIGEDRSLEYYWLLSRTPSLPEDEELREKILTVKHESGIVDDELIVTEHFAEGVTDNQMANAKPNLAVLTLITLCIAHVRGFVVKDGNCTLVTTNLPVVESFEVEKYIGKWYELERYEQQYQRNHDCVTTQYRRSDPIGKVQVTTRGFFNGTHSNFTDIGVFSDVSNPKVAKFKINLAKATNSSNYWIVDTDYTNYAIVYTCTPVLESDQSVEGYWLLSRTRKLTDTKEVLERVNYLRSTYFEPGHIRRTNQTEELEGDDHQRRQHRSSIIKHQLDCIMFKRSFGKVVVVLLAAVAVPSIGQRIVNQLCPDPASRPVVQYFDLERYVEGRWYEILRYEQYFEKDCDCGYATYTPQPDGSVKVENCCERLPNTTVKCSIGKAVVSFPDQFPVEGKFNVTFGGPPNNSNYWIMETDYDNFAVIYYCKNISDSKSAEAAWVLSKQRTINPTVRAVVDKLVDKYLVRQDMRVTEQSQEKCKYASGG
ncbi:uncharacterized protein LOC118460775 [Anopheles albimanus]|uniref:uncharacterized protein LOC118460775 n=1 Tax=Anopheles albimanus TaxID=7167 RepID=UPI00163E6D14|nr:uncharacterized protein LOC118460775 [Anopheles albimanus]